MILKEFKMFFLGKRYVLILCLVSLNILISSCTNASEKKCKSDNVNQNLNCLSKDNVFLKKQLNDKEKDFKKWEKETYNKCEGRLNYSLGEGAALARESCYNQEYKTRLNGLNQDKKSTEILRKIENVDGFYITPLPYNSNDHINCILSEQKNICNRVNLIESTSLIKVYNFINPSYGDSVVFSETTNGVLLIASPSSGEGENPEINLTSVNKFGLVKSITLDASKNISINQKYEILYKEHGKDYKIKLNSDGEFVK